MKSSTKAFEGWQRLLTKSLRWWVGRWEPPLHLRDHLMQLLGRRDPGHRLLFSSAKVAKQCVSTSCMLCLAPYVGSSSGTVFAVSPRKVLLIAQSVKLRNGMRSSALFGFGAS